MEVVRPLELTATPLKPGQSEEELDPEPPRGWPNGPEVCSPRSSSESSTSGTRKHRC